MADPASRPHITSATPGPALAIICLCTAAASALVAGTAIFYQARHKQMNRSSYLDVNWNVLLGVGLLVSIAQSAVTFKQVAYGLGYPISMESAHDLRKFEHLEYASNLLYIGALWILKGVQFLLQFATTYPKPSYYIPAAVMAGMFAFLLAAAFECIAPKVWAIRSGKCYNQTAFWITFGVFDILTDVYSTLVVIHATMNLQMQTATKRKLLVVLGMKFLPAVCAITRLTFVAHAYTSADYTLTSYRLAIPTQLQVHLAIVALSIGKVFRFLNALDTGYLSSAIDAPGRNGTTFGRSQNTHGRKTSLSDSSKGLVPGDYGQSRAYAEALPMEKSNHWQSSGRQIDVRTDVEITHEPFGRLTPNLELT